jgi:hypothetical protein
VPAPLAAAAAGLVALASLALPTPPDAVKFPNKKGDVTLDHRLHLARRATCAACHGPGIVGKVPPFGIQRAHLVCIGCHRENKRGPVLCIGCHGGVPTPGNAGPDAAPPDGSPPARAPADAAG